MENKKWTKQEILTLIETKDIAVHRAILAIFNKQTESERNSNETNQENGIGFNGVDAPFLSSLAKQIIARGYISNKQIEIARKSIKKYAGQLTRIANGEL